MKITREIAGQVRRRRLDLLIAFLLFGMAMAAGSFYYRLYLELEDRQRTPMRPPAVQIDVPVLLVCGQGFMRPAKKLEPLTQFVRMRAPQFACTDLPPDLQVREPAGMAYKHLYLLSSIALTWIVAGTVSWAALAPLFGFFFGTVIVLSYALFRLGMGRLLATLGSLALIVSPLHLAHLFNLRDYSKAPFILATLLIMGWMATRALNGAAVLGLSVVAGTLLGFGFGFRADMPIVIPAFVATLLIFLPGQILGRVKLKAAGIILFLGCFLLAGWPMIERRSSSHRLFHAALVGLTDDRLAGIGVANPLYSLGGDGAQKDRFISITVNANALRTHGEERPPYKRISAEYYQEIGRHFPADVLLLAYASTLKILELPFMNPVDYASLPNTGVLLPNQPFPAGIESETIKSLYRFWVGVLTSFQGMGLTLALATLLLIATQNLRLAAFLLCCILYFGGYPAIQFETRHFFHLELISLWTLGFVIQRFAQLIAAHCWPVKPLQLSRLAKLLRPLPRLVLAPLVALAVALLGPLLMLRGVQTWHLGDVLETYADAKLNRLELKEVSESSETVRFESPELLASLAAQGPLHAEYLVAEFSSKACDFSTVEFVAYYSAPAEFIAARGSFRFDLPVWDLSHELTIEVPADSGQVSKVIFPIYQASSNGVLFGGLELPKAQAGCLESLSRVDDIGSLPLPVGFIIKLLPDWPNQPLYKFLSKRDTAAREQERVYTASSNLAISNRELGSALAELPGSKLSVHTESVQFEGDTWRIRGKAEGRFSPLAQIDEVELARDSRLVIKGEVRKGGLVLGLTHQDAWDGSEIVVGKDSWTTLGFYEKHRRILDLVRDDDWNRIETVVFAQAGPTPTTTLYDQWSVIQVADRGRFVAVFDVPTAGRYSLVLANAVSLPRARNDVVIDEIGWMKSTRD